MFINQTFTKGLYPTGSYIITTLPTATFPTDHKYCFIGDNTLDVEIVWHNVHAYGEEIVDHIDDELAKADISIDWGFSDFDTDAQTFFDFEFELLMQDFKGSSEFVLVFTNMMPPADAEYYNLGGYARLSNHFAIIFTENLGTSQHVSSIGLHELCHLLGYWHSENPDDVMYPTYNGANNILTDETVDILYELHH
jgi:hypothetical protein